MLALRRVPLRPSRPHLPRVFIRHGDTPSNRRFFLQTLGDGFLDLAIALPIPPTLPAYSTTIIITTIVARFVLLPVAIWGKRRAMRMEDLALPELEKMKPHVSKQVFEIMKSKGIRGDKEYLKKYHKERSIEALTKIREDLFKKYKCSPTPSMVIPPLTQLPVFVTGTLMLGRLSLDPTPFDSESFLTLTTLAHPDPTMTLPIVLGLLSMANVESSNWVLNAAEREQARKVEERAAKVVAEGGEVKLKPRTIIKSALRGLSVGRIVICAMTPGSIALYWVTSAAFGLIQTWFMDWQDIRRRRRNAATSVLPPRPVQLIRPTPPRPVATKPKVKQRHS